MPQDSELGRRFECVFETPKYPSSNERGSTFKLIYWVVIQPEGRWMAQPTLMDEVPFEKLKMQQYGGCATTNFPASEQRIEKGENSESLGCPAELVT